MSTHANAVVVHKHPSDALGAKLAMWLFLFTEVLLFGGLFILYAVYRAKHPVDFHNAAAELNTALGTINTLVLLTSSLTVALSIEALQRGARKLSISLLTFTIICGLIFLVIKYFEWSAKIHHGIFPGAEELMTFSNGEILFFYLYFSMTGLHALHVIIGMSVLGVVLYFIARKPIAKEAMDRNIIARLKGNARLAVVTGNGNPIGDVLTIDDDAERIDIRVTYRPVAEKLNPRDFIKLENAGLYWHLVDVIWIFLFPLFYLIT